MPGSRFPPYWRDCLALCERNHWTCLSWVPHTPSSPYLSAQAVCHTAAICSHFPETVCGTGINNPSRHRRWVYPSRISPHFSSPPSQLAALPFLGAVSFVFLDIIGLLRQPLVDWLRSRPWAVLTATVTGFEAISQTLLANAWPDACCNSKSDLALMCCWFKQMNFGGRHWGSQWSPDSVWCWGTGPRWADCPCCS